MHDSSSLPPEAQREFLNGPALTPPAGVTPNFQNSPNRNDISISVATVALVIGAVSFFIRIWSRIVILRRCRVEDFFVIIGFATFTAYIWTMYAISNETGYFVHMWNVQLKGLNKFLWLLHLGTNFYVSCILTLKTAILLEWMHIFVVKGTRNAFYWCCITLLILNTLLYASALFVENLRCFPFQKTWDKTKPGRCVDLRYFAAVTGIGNVVSDLLILGLPQRVAWKLNMSLKRRIGLSLIFALGAFACSSAIARLVVTIGFLETQDATYSISSISIWVGAEMTSLLLVICIPSAPKVFNDFKVKGKLMISLRSRHIPPTREIIKLESKNDVSHPHLALPQQVLHKHSCGEVSETSFFATFPRTKTTSPTTSSAEKSRPIERY